MNRFDLPAGYRVYSVIKPHEAVIGWMRVEWHWEADDGSEDESCGFDSREQAINEAWADARAERRDYSKVWGVEK